MLNPSRITLARKRSRLTARELADRAGIAAVHMSRIEKGKAENVDPATIAELAKVTKFPYEFFFGDDVDTPNKDSTSFRSLTAMSAKERESALAAGSIANILSDWCESKFNLPEPDLPDYRHDVFPEAAAASLRSYWGLGNKPVSNTIKLLESKGVRVFSLSEDTRNVDAFSYWRNNIPYVFLNTKKTAERSRFDAMHELGHLVMHRHGKPQGRQAEYEADRFAANLLMPHEDVQASIRRVNNLEQLFSAKQRWGVSVAALSYRLHKLSIITDWQYKNFCIQLNSRYGQSEPNEMKRERSVVWEKIFRELWKEKVTRDGLAKKLSIPSSEIDSLVFNLLPREESENSKVGLREITSSPKLSLAE